MSEPSGAAAADDPLARSVDSLAGIGPARAAAFARLGVTCLRDLLFLAPRELARQGPHLSAELAREEEGREVSVTGTLSRPSTFRRGRRRSVTRVEVRDATGTIGALWFNQPWLRETLRERAAAEAEVSLYGKVVQTKRGPALASPRLGGDERPFPAPGTVHPVYPTTDGLGAELVGRAVRDAIEGGLDDLVDPLPLPVLTEHRLPGLRETVLGLHRPRDEEEFVAAGRRLALERLLDLQAALHPGGNLAPGRARPIALDDAAREGLRSLYPFPLTAGQERVLDEILDDVAETAPMRRLLQGDVGSGKTLVAAFAALAAARGGGQTALMAPTELLAEQHHLELSGRFAALGVSCVLHTASAPAARRRRVLAEIASGKAEVVVGTHALFSDGIAFRRLDLAVIDEQQRFGVAQKQALLEKGRDVHLLLMTATPIPRTLALCLYGDLATSLLTEMPPGRGAVRTRRARGERDARRLVRERLAAGERAFWVCPRIDASDAGEAGAAAEERFRELAASPLAKHGMVLVHGRVPAEERGARIEAFRDGRAALLVATSVIEVGVDVAEATVMVIEGAERFGLSQLHQLRGRIGRGSKPSWCLLLTKGKPAAEVAARLEILESSRDGFLIAEEDLRQRGMGELAGVRQAGGSAWGPAGSVPDEELALLARRLLLEIPALAAARVAPGGASGKAPAAIV